MPGGVTVDSRTFQPIEAIDHADPEEAGLLRGLAVQALDYIQGFGWGPPLRQVLLARGVGGMFGLFLVRFTEPAGGVDDELWVVSGDDLPPAYFVIDDAATPEAAVATYCALMNDWIEAVLTGGDLDGVFPVDAEPTQENAESLLARLAFIRELPL